MATDRKHWVSEHLKDKRVKIPILILLYFFIGFCLFLFIKGSLGYPVKFLGIEMNQPTPKTDTIKMTQPTVSRDTIRIEVAATEKQQSPTNVPLPGKENKRPDTVTVVQGKNVNTGTNNGIIGDNATISGPIQARPTQKEVIEFNKRFPDRSMKVVISWESGNRRAEMFATDFITLLKTNGYKSVEWSIVMGNFSAEPIGLLIMKSDPAEAHILVHL